MQVGRIAAVVLVVLVGEVAAGPRARDGGAAAATASTPLGARIAAVAGEVAAVRGLGRGKAVVAEPVDQAALTARVAAVLAVSPAETLALRRLGFIEVTADPNALLAAALVDVGPVRYEASSHHLLVTRAVVASPATSELAIARELARRAIDARFELAPAKVADVDAAQARAALIEGDALATMVEVALARDKGAAPWSDPRVAAALASELDAPAGALAGASPWVRSRVLVPARAGLGLIAALRRRAPWAAVDAAYRRPPRSSAQVLHPARYVADERPVAVKLATPPALRGLTRRHEATWGEASFVAWLEAQGVDGEVAALAGAGWSGDRAVVFAADGDGPAADAVGVWRLEWETEADAIEAAEAATRAVDHLVGGVGDERAEGRARWRDGDGKVASVERRGTTLLIVVGAPAAAAAALLTELWPAARRP
jgi:hypothetical protein